MMDQWIVFAVLAATLGLFIHGRWRYDVVAIAALITLTFCGIVDADEAFVGFGHPAVITVAAVLMLSAALQNAGVVDSMAQVITTITERPVVQMILLNFFVMVISAFMNNVGALAILMPVAIQLARNQNRSPSQYLMPLAFCSLLGGMTTEIGTPPNIIVSAMRTDRLGEPFSMFAFTPVGASVAIAGFVFLSLIGWRMIPKRQGARSRDELFEIEGYLTELEVVEGSKAIEMTVRQFEELVERDVLILAIIRSERKLSAPSAAELIREGDLLLVESDPDTLQRLMDQTAVVPLGGKDLSGELSAGGDVSLSEVVVRPASRIIGRRVRDLHLRWRYGVNLLAVARSGKRVSERLGKIVIRAGDVLLLRGTEQALQEVLSEIGCLPLATRNLRYGEPRRILLAVAIFAAAVICTISGWTSISVSFVAAVVTMHMTGLLRVRELYSAIDLSIIVLLGAMIPVGIAMEKTGGAELIASQVLRLTGDGSPVLALGVTLVVTMFLSDLVNNATAAILMVPIAQQIALSFPVHPDSYLMAVAIGASCPFLTPIGHQSNALILGPGGYRFSDYWKVGLPLEILIVSVAIPVLLWAWPF